MNYKVLLRKCQTDFKLFTRAAYDAVSFLKGINSVKKKHYEKSQTNFAKSQ